MTTKYSNEILNEREKSYGSFKINAQLTQQLKQQVRGMTGWNQLASEQKESIDMIFTKISRLVVGDGTHKDSWDDIAGYAELISSTLKEKNNENIT